MSKNYPDSIPAAHRKSAFRTECYAMGWNAGHGIACHNVPTIGETICTDSDGSQIVDADNIRDIHSQVCFEAESNARCFSPWEFKAHRINTSRNPEGGWEAYDEGVADSIAADLEGYSDEDYGIES